MLSCSPDACSALITAAGASTRMGTGKKKELELIDGLPVIAWALRAFLESNLFGFFVITYPRTERDAVARSLTCVKDIRDIVLVEGGDSRQQSVYNGLVALDNLAQRYVLIHDGSRPWIAPILIRQVLEGAIQFGACIPVVQPVDAVKRIASDGTITDHVQRAEYVSAQTPQGFAYQEILNAHRAAADANMTYPDDAQAYHESIGPVHAIDGDPANVKITYGHDLP